MFLAALIKLEKEESLRKAYENSHVLSVSDSFLLPYAQV